VSPFWASFWITLPFLVPVAFWFGLRAYSAQLEKVRKAAPVAATSSAERVDDEVPHDQYADARADLHRRRIIAKVALWSLPVLPFLYLPAFVPLLVLLRGASWVPTVFLVVDLWMPAAIFIASARYLRSLRSTT
jgi:hypothetical protein